MVLQDVDIIRIRKEIPVIKMKAHKGICTFCGEVVKMQRDQEPPYPLKPDQCFCLNCGAQHKVITGNIQEWEQEQWNQKNDL